MASKVEAPTQISWVPAAKIQAHTDNVRGQNLGDLSELKNSIKARGLLQVPTVIGTDAGFTIITGHRRIQAMRELGVDPMPVVVREATDAAGELADMLVENLQRENLTPMQEARALTRLATLGWKQAEIAKQIGRTQAHVSRRIQFTKLPEEIQEAVDAGGIAINDVTYLFPLMDDPDLLLRVFHNRDRGPIQNLVIQAQAAKEKEKAKDKTEAPEKSEDEVKAAKDAASRRRALNRQTRQATEDRAKLLNSLLKQRIAKTRVAEFTLLQLLVNTPQTILEVTYGILGIQKVERKNGFGQVWDVEGYIAQNAEENVHRLGYAVALMQGHLALTDAKEPLAGANHVLAKRTLDHLRQVLSYEPVSAELYMIGEATFDVAEKSKKPETGIQVVELNWTFCPECKGEGEVDGSICETCEGRGQVPLSESAEEPEVVSAPTE